jgi:hypothetical protein
MNRSRLQADVWDQSSTDYQRAMDFGLTDDYEVYHFTSTRWCTCQFGKSTGLNCCQHIFFVRVLQNDQSELVADKFWYKDEAIEATENLALQFHQPQIPFSQQKEASKGIYLQH